MVSAMAKTLTTMAALLATTATLTHPLPVPKLGSCPPAYAQSSNYCVSMRDAPVAVPQAAGRCPSGWASLAHYCTQMRR